MKKRKTCIALLVMLALFATFLIGCGQESSNLPFTYRAPSTPSGSEESAEEEASADVYLIVQLDMVEETLTLLAPETGRELRYAYTLGTKFLDKYGDSYSSVHFTPGQAVTIGELTASSTLSSVQMADSVWNQTDITRYSIDADKGIFTIGQTKYRITDATRIFSQDAMVELASIGEDDTLQVIGRDKEILSVIVTTGHGYIQLQNSSTFVDSMMCIGNRIFTRVTGDMLIEVPEGTYDITVANDGYGGTGSYTVTRGETTNVDLDALKGEGPKKCQLTFTSEVAGVAVYVDGTQITVGETMEVTYGSHSLKVVADGYDTWNKTLVVNSASATIALDLTEESDSTDTSTTTSDTSSSSSSGSSSSSSGSSNSSSTSNSSSSSSTTSDLTDTEVDYLTTISDMLTTLLD